MAGQLPDWLAVGVSGLALAVSCSHLVVDYCWPADIKSTSPEQVYVFEDVKPNSGSRVHLVARRTYYSLQKFGQSAVLEKEQAGIIVGDLRFILKWQSFGDYLTDKESGGVTRPDYTAAHPAVIEPASVVSHETEFVPHGIENVVSWQRFLKEVQGGEDVIFCFMAEFDGETKLIEGCSAESYKVDSQDKESSPVCAPLETTSKCKELFEGVS